MSATVPMKQEECCSCHIVFWMPESLYRQLREQPKHKHFWCPAGHEQWYTAESELDKERRARQQAQQENARLAEEHAQAERARQKAERELKTHKRRAAAGTCPCCQRTFTNMARHMKTKHPAFVKSNVIELKSA